MQDVYRDTDPTGSKGPVLLSPIRWELATERMPGREVEYVLGLGIFNDVRIIGYIDGSYCATVITDIVNYYPDRVGDIEKAMLEALQNFPGYLAQEIAGKIAGRFDEFPLHEDILKRQQLKQIRDVLSAYAAPVTDPDHPL